jgi:hypothetical protein
MSLKQIFKILFWRSALPLLIGLAVYLFFHKPNLLLHQWVSKYFTIPDYYSRVNKFPVAVFFINHFADCLWAYSITSFLMLLISNSFPFNLKAALIIVLVSATEIIQVFFPKQFTFDRIDLFLSIAVSFFTLIFWPYEKENAL